MMQLIDSHCHIDFPIFDDDRAEVLTQCKQAGITDIIVPAVSANTWDRLLSICNQDTMLHPTLGLHPMFMAEHNKSDIAKLEDYVKQFTPVAIGEIGLDFFVEGHDKQSQIALFEQQLLIAKKHHLPVILHLRKAYDQALVLLKKHNITQGIVHAFSGSEQQANHFIKQGFLLGIGGVITYDKATKIRRIFQQMPLTHIALETDAPDMPLADQTSSRNSPANIPSILSHLASHRTESLADIAAKTTLNIQTTFFQ